ncbi:MAG: hypothetical protein ACI9QL_001605 [Candidatus Omnitrophota bacterium]
MRPSTGGLDDTAFGGATFPLASVTTAGAYTDYGFSGNWLANSGANAADSAILEFNNLPMHNSLSLQFLLAAADSVDASDTPFTVRVDGVDLFVHKFNTGGYNLDGTPGVTSLALLENLNGNYREQWQDNAGAGPANDADRVALTWTLDSAYDVNTLSALTDIPHTSDTLTIEFLHGLSSDFNDELTALDNLSITLNVIPEPGSFALLSLGLFGLGGYILRRRKA